MIDDVAWVQDPRYELAEVTRPEFPTLRKGGLDPAPVDAYVQRLEGLIEDFAAFSRDLESRISHTRAEASATKAADQAAIDEAMLAAFEAKERILLQAEERAWEIEEEARQRLAAVARSAAAVDLPDTEMSDLRDRLLVAEQRIADLELQVEAWRRRATRLESDAQRGVAFAADVADRRRQVDTAAQQAADVLAAAERRSQAMLAAARAEAALIADEAAGTADAD